MADVLLIDDMPGVRRSIEVMLKSAGHRVTVATDGAHGLEQLKQQRFDLVICDILMPNVDGTEVIFQLNTLPYRPPVIAMSGGGAGVSASEALRMARFKADAFIEKPFERNELKSIIDRLLSKAA